MKFFDSLRMNKFSNNFMRWISTLLFFPLAFFVRFVGGTWLILDHDYKAYLINFILFGSVFLGWLTWKWFSKSKLYLTGLEKYLGLFLFTALLSTLFSVNKSISIEKLSGVIAYLLSIYVLIDIRKNQNLWGGMINAVLLVAGISSLISLYPMYHTIKVFEISVMDAINNPGYVIDVIPRLPDFINFHHSVTAGYLVLIFPLMLYNFVKTKNLLWKIVSIISLFFMVILFIFTKSRGGFIGLFLSFVIGIYIYRKSIYKLILRHKLISILSLIVTLGFFLGVFVIILSTRGFSFKSGTIILRYQAWFAVFQMLKESPLFGTGLGTFGMKYLQFRDPNVHSGTMIHAHNQLFQTIGVMGVSGLFSVIILGITFFRKIKDNVVWKDFSIVSVIALTGLSGVLLPDAIFTSSQIVLLVLIYVLGLIPKEAYLETNQKYNWLTGLSLIAFILGITGVWICWKLEPYYRSRVAANNGNWGRASVLLKEAKSRDVKNPYYDHALGLTAGQEACNNGNGYEKGIVYYENSIDKYYGWSVDYTNLALLLSETNDYKQASNAISLAIRFDPNNPLNYCLQGDFYRKQNKMASAVEAYGKCISLNPDWIDSTYWNYPEERKKLLDRVVSSAKEQLYLGDDADNLIKLGNLHLVQGEFQESMKAIRSYQDQRPGELSALMVKSRIHLAKGDYEKAIDALNKVLLENPRYSEAWVYLGKAYYQTDDYVKAKSALIKSFFLDGSPYTNWILGKLFVMSNNDDLGFFIMSKNLITSGSDSRFSHHVAGRWPLPVKYLDCVPRIRSYTMDVNPAKNTANYLSESHCLHAYCIYNDLLQDAPTLKLAEELENISCSAKNVDCNALFSK